MGPRILVVVAALGMGSGAAIGQAESEGAWSPEASGYNFARGGVATDGAYLFLFGGYQVGVTASYPSYYRAARRYDPATDTWTTLAALPNTPSGVTYQYNAGAYFDGRLYSFGTSASGAPGVVLSYSISENAWTILSGVSFPEGRYGAAAAVLGDRIYLAGGYANGYSRRTDEFDPADNSFTRRADLPVGLHLHAMAPMPWRNSAYVVGGVSGGAYQAGCYEYSPSSDAWATRSPMQIDGALQPRRSPAAFLINNRIYVSGGHNGSGSAASVLEYFPGSDEWTVRPPMSEARYQHAAIEINGRGYVYGGISAYTSGEEFTPPDFGPPPQPPADVIQAGGQIESSLQAGEDFARRDGWMGGRIFFSADVLDPDAGQRVRLRIRVKPVGVAPWTEVDSGLADQGPIRVEYEITGEGAFDWEYRVEDENANSFPAAPDEWAPAFGNAGSPDFRSDQAPPSNPGPLYPDDADVGVPDPAGGLVTLAWTASSDNGADSEISYEVEVGMDSGLHKPVIQSVASGIESLSIRLPVTRSPWHWRVRARDVAGNFSAWSRALEFRVVHDDGLNHAAGDGRKTCGYGAGSAPGQRGTGIAALALALAVSIVHWRIRRPMNDASRT